MTGVTLTYVAPRVIAELRADGVVVNHKRVERVMRENGIVGVGVFTSWAFTRRAPDSGLVPSVGSIGDCYDNAVIESFWGRMQTELLNRKRWKTRIELANAMFEYLEIFHNRQRRHSALGMLTPIEFENVHFTRQPVA